MGLKRKGGIGASCIWMVLPIGLLSILCLVVIILFINFHNSGRWPMLRPNANIILLESCYTKSCYTHYIPQESLESIVSPCLIIPPNHIRFMNSPPCLHQRGSTTTWVSKLLCALDISDDGTYQARKFAKPIQVLAWNPCVCVYVCQYMCPSFCKGFTLRSCHFQKFLHLPQGKLTYIDGERTSSTSLSLYVYPRVSCYNRLIPKYKHRHKYIYIYICIYIYM